MRPIHSTIRDSSVYQLAHKTLEKSFAWKAFRQSVSISQLIDLLLQMAATGRTLFGVVERFFNFCHETARQALLSNLPKADVLTEKLVNALHDVLTFSRKDRRRRWTVAIDTHNVPYYGSHNTAGIVGGQKKQGTKYFFSYATAVLIHKRRRYTVGLMAITKSTPVHEIVTTLLGQIDQHQLLIGGVVLDSGFDSGETILLLQSRKVSYTVPLRRKGKGTNRRNACFAWASGTVGKVDWVTEKSRTAVSTRVLVWKRSSQPETKVYAFSGWGDAKAIKEARRAWLGRRRYRERFGIETSYRQKNQARGWTTSRSVEYRLLLEGLAHLLRQIWVRLSEAIARALKLKPKTWVALRLCDLLETLSDQLKTLYQAKPLISSDNNTL
jgi:hypothetical protein